MKVLLLENIHDSAILALKNAGHEVVTVPGSLDHADLVSALGDVDLLGIRSNTSVTAQTIAAVPHLRAIGCFCIGTNQVDLDAASGAGLAVFNAPYSNSRSVVELVIGEIIALARRLVEKTERMHAGVWDKSARGSHEVRGRVLGIVGYGNIGTQLANLAESLGMRVIFYDIADRPAHGNARRAETLHELLRHSDVVSIHVDGRPGNAGMFGAAEFDAMKPGALFINASRGMVVDDVALRERLLSGHIAGAAMDVFPVEPKAQGDSFESALRGLDNVILTPHVAASTQEAQEEIGRFVSNKLLSYTGHGATGLSVNLPEVVLPPVPLGSSRLVCLYDAMRPVLPAVAGAFGEHGVTVTQQQLSTRGALGYLVADAAGVLPDGVLATVRSTPGVAWAHALGAESAPVAS